MRSYGQMGRLHCRACVQSAEVTLCFWLPATFSFHSHLDLSGCYNGAQHKPEEQTSSSTKARCRFLRDLSGRYSDDAVPWPCCLQSPSQNRRPAVRCRDQNTFLHSRGLWTFSFWVYSRWRPRNCWTLGESMDMGVGTGKLHWDSTSAMILLNGREGARGAIYTPATLSCVHMFLICALWWNVKAAMGTCLDLGVAGKTTIYCPSLFALFRSQWCAACLKQSSPSSEGTPLVMMEDWW